MALDLLGYTKDEVLDVGMPYDLYEEVYDSEVELHSDTNVEKWTRLGSDEWVDVAVDVNDSSDHTEPAREEKLVEIFANVGIALTFID